MGRLSMARSAEDRLCGIAEENGAGRDIRVPPRCAKRPCWNRDLIFERSPKRTRCFATLARRRLCGKTPPRGRLDTRGNRSCLEAVKAFPLCPAASRENQRISWHVVSVWDSGKGVKREGGLPLWRCGGREKRGGQFPPSRCLSLHKKSGCGLPAERPKGSLLRWEGVTGGCRSRRRGCG